MEKQRNRKAMVYSFILHLGVLLIAVLPLVSMVKKSESVLVESYQYIEIEFENGDMSPSSSSTAKGEIVNVEIEPVEKVISEKQEIESSEETTAAKNEEVSEMEVVELKMEEGTQKSDVPVDEITQEEVQSSEDISNDPGMGSDTEGEGEVGEEITGVALSNMDFEGEGVFGRKIIYHANISKLAKEEGRVVVNLCINRSGDVTHVAFNRDASSITNPVYVRKVMSVAGKYRFEADYTAPKVQCGKLTFIFEFK